MAYDLCLAKKKQDTTQINETICTLNIFQRLKLKI